jgi:hypothetical protein
MGGGPRRRALASRVISSNEFWRLKTERLKVITNPEGQESHKESSPMFSTVITTVVKMMESLPEPVQDRVADHLREYIEDLREELQWEATFKKTQSQLVAAARQAKQEMAAGQANPLDHEQL